MKTVVTVTGIRPDFIRMSEVFRKLDASFNHILVHTGQHYDDLLSGVFFKDLKIREPDFNLQVGGSGKAHYQQQAELGPKIISLFKEHSINPDIVLFLGDSNSVLASVPLKKEGHRIGHIEAGMRSYDERMLEEINRKVCDHVSDLLFVYHENYKQKALREGIAEDRIFVVGNTIIEPLNRFKQSLSPGGDRHILLDIHRPENFKSPERMRNILASSKSYGDHYNISVKMLGFGRTLRAIEEHGIDLGFDFIPLMGYKEFLQFQNDSLFIVSDSGTAQEEPALLDIPVVVPRDFTERPESVENGNSFMLNVNDSQIEESFMSSIDWLDAYYVSKRSSEWLGDGQTSAKIVEILKRVL